MVMMTRINRPITASIAYTCPGIPGSSEIQKHLLPHKPECVYTHSNTDPW